MQIVYPRYYLFPVIMKDDFDFNPREEDIEVFAPPKAKSEDVFEELDEEFVNEFLKE